MGLHAIYYLVCDVCGIDTGSSQSTIEEAIEYGERGGWSIYDGDDWDKVYCEGCKPVEGSST